MAGDDERSGVNDFTLPPELRDAVANLVRAVARRGRDRMRDAASTGRHRLELRQLHKDRDAFWARLGKTAYRLAEAGEIDHPALRKAMERIDELDRAIAAMESSGHHLTTPKGNDGSAD
jgi:hypothetical protein